MKGKKQLQLNHFFVVARFALSQVKMRQKYNFDHAERQLNSMIGSGTNAFELRKLIETVLGTQDHIEIINFTFFKEL